MLRLRPYKKCDAEYIASWCKDERALRKWSSDRFGDFPVTADEIDRKYYDLNGDCPDEDNFFPVTAFDESGTVGSLIMRFTDTDKKTVRLGFIIVDDSKRGKGYGREMIRLAFIYAFGLLKAEKVTLGVFDNNMPAYRCYKAAGFRETEMKEDIIFEIFGEKWKIIELEITKEEYESISGGVQNG